MDFGISTRCFGTTPLSPQLLDRIPASEFAHIELHITLPGFDYHNRSMLREVAGWFRDNEMPAPSIHLPFEEDIFAERQIDRQRFIDELKRCLEFGDLLPIRYAVLHWGGPGQKYSPAFFEYAYAAISMIQSFSGMRVLIETLGNEIATFEHIGEFKTAAQIADIGICYDTGHGEMEGPADAIHLNDNNGDQRDDHLWPFQGKRDWPALIERLLQLSFDGPLVLEARDDRFDHGVSARSRLRDLWDEAKDSIEEFRLKYKLPEIAQEEEE